MDTYTQEYLRIVQDTIDPEASVDRHGNVVFIEQEPLEPLTRVRTVTPEECRKIISDMYGSV